jgi:hypothetical protein
MNTVSAMGFLRAHLSDENVADIAAYLATVLSGADLAALPSPMPTTDFFGAQLVSSPSGPRRIEIRGAASAPVALGGIVSSRPDVFPAVSDCPASLLPGTRCTVSVRFVPGAAGDSTGLISIVDPSGTTLRSATVTGEGTEAAPPVLAWAEGAPSIDFGDVTLGGSVARRLTLVNTGPCAVRLTRLRASGAAASRFQLTGTCMTGTVLAGGANCAIDVGFAPATVGGVEAWIEIVASATSPPLVRLAAQASTVRRAHRRSPSRRAAARKGRPRAVARPSPGPCSCSRSAPSCSPDAPSHRRCMPPSMAWHAARKTTPAVMPRQTPSLETCWAALTAAT